MFYLLVGGAYRNAFGVPDAHSTICSAPIGSNVIWTPQGLNAPLGSPSERGDRVNGLAHR